MNSEPAYKTEDRPAVTSLNMTVRKQVRQRGRPCAGTGKSAPPPLPTPHTPPPPPPRPPLGHQEYDRIARENQAIMTRILQREPHFDRHALEEDWKVTKRYLHAISEYPFILGNLPPATRKSTLKPLKAGDTAPEDNIFVRVETTVEGDEIKTRTVSSRAEPDPGSTGPRSSARPPPGLLVGTRGAPPRGRLCTPTTVPRRRRGQPRSRGKRRRRRRAENHPARRGGLRGRRCGLRRRARAGRGPRRVSLALASRASGHESGRSR